MELLKKNINNLSKNKVPIGCLLLNQKTFQYIIEWNGESPIDHCEILILQKAQNLHWNFRESTIFITCEPCSMCITALSLVKINCIVFGCYNEIFGGCGSAIDIFQNKHLYKPMIIGGIMEEYWKNQLIKYFQNLRN